MSVFGVILVCIFPHSDWMRRDTAPSFIILSKCLILILLIWNTDTRAQRLKNGQSYLWLILLQRHRRNSLTSFWCLYCQRWIPATLLKKRLRHRYFPKNFGKFLRTPFFIEHFWWLFLPVNRCTMELILGLENKIKFGYNNLWVLKTKWNSDTTVCFCYSCYLLIMHRYTNALSLWFSNGNM